MIVVLGRPGLDADDRLDRAAGRIAVAAAAAGARVELVGSVGDDADGEAVALELGKAGVGHAALLRDPAGGTPRVAGDDAPSNARPLARLDPADLELGLRYIADCRVLVAAEPLDAPALAVVTDAATYHGAALILVTDSAAAAQDLPQSATVLEMPEQDGGAFATLIGRYAARLESGRAAPDAWREAIAETGWETSAE